MPKLLFFKRSIPLKLFMIEGQLKAVGMCSIEAAYIAKKITKALQKKIKIRYPELIKYVAGKISKFFCEMHSICYGPPL